MGYSWSRTMIAARRAISDTERRFPVRIRIGVPPRGLGDRLDQIQTWLDANCGADGWAMSPAGLRGPLNDAIAIYFNDATLAAAFVARWCAGYRAESTDGVFQIREDEPTPLSLRYCVALDGSFASGAASRRKSDLNPFGKNGHRRESASNSENRVGSPYSGETPGPDSRPRHPPILAPLTGGLHEDLLKFVIIYFYVTASCSSNIEMTPLCKVDVTLPRILGSRGMRRGGGVDEQAGVQRAGGVIVRSIRPPPYCRCV